MFGNICIEQFRHLKVFNTLTGDIRLARYHRSQPKVFFTFWLYMPR